MLAATSPKVNPRRFHRILIPNGLFVCSPYRLFAILRCINTVGAFSFATPRWWWRTVDTLGIGLCAI